MSNSVPAPPSMSSHRMISPHGDLTNLYNISQMNGQLIVIYKGNDKQKPKRGTEVFIKRLPRRALLQDIFQFVYLCGPVYKIRLLLDFSGFNRGFGFVTFFDIYASRKAVCCLNGLEIVPNWPVIVKLSFDNNKLFLSGVPLTISLPEITSLMKNSPQLGKGLKTVTNERGQGHFLLQYFTHHQALVARKTVWPAFEFQGHAILIDWAVPRVIRYCTKLYMTGIPPDCSKLELFEELSKKLDLRKILNVIHLDEDGYILFQDSDSSLRAVDTLSGLLVKGKPIQFSSDTNFVPRLHKKLDEYYKRDRMQKHERQQKVSMEKLGIPIPTFTEASTSANLSLFQANYSQMPADNAYGSLDTSSGTWAPAERTFSLFGPTTYNITF